ncbi:translation initiation factor IF-3 [Amygdalobacter nucleatus]|uniref:Translation initiation factor IF-3 n=1 Tax=Amygdalobacter nucleatus TaxID=3029274 RepID=A0A133YAG5_9FIRM|nr:translation initiation factor IF-3 [Amygdalobacter nucleatus]KXB40182.1 translation initiation factor IF-3 [Amygdalobacter nucleatus]MDF0485788.1 translation initiation factor IF-3 [Amygdalobacter nucleatus]WEG36378.1 translation initiation factor IF-3 [Amygdalobacter nucleatus]
MRLCFFISGGVTIAKKQERVQVNESIVYQKLRVISQNGEQLGDMTLQAALNEAHSANLDLVLVADNPANPVAKIMDYGKYLFEQKKHKKEAKKNQKVQELKEVQLKLTTDEHDLSFKRKNTCKWLEDGNKVKVAIRFRGREMTYVDQGLEVMRKFAESCQDLAVIEKAPKLEGRNMLMFLAPKKAK